MSGAASFLRGDLMFSIPLNPKVELWCQRLAAFERFRFVNVAVSYCPNVPTTAGAKICGYYESDIESPIIVGEGEATIRQVMSHEGASMVDIWTGHSWVRSASSDQEMFYTGSSNHEPRLANQGMFSVVAGTDMDDVNLPAILGDLTISYEIEFAKPSLGDSDYGEETVFGSSMVGCTAALPFGDAIKFFAQYDPSTTEVFSDTVPVAYDPVTGHMRVPRGYYHFEVQFTGSAETQVTATLGGLYRLLQYRVDSTHIYNDTYTAVESAAIGAVMSFSFYSSGLTSDYFYIHQTAAPSHTGIVARILPLGGDAPFVSSLASLTNRLEDLVKFTGYKDETATSTSSTAPSKKGKEHADTDERVVVRRTH
jgi:hypothetical protein